MNYTLDTEKPWKTTYQQLGTEFERWGRQLRGRVNWSVENMRGYRDVTLRYTLPGQPEVTLTMNKQGNAESNLRVLYLAIEAMRLNHLRGVEDLVREAYLALPAPAKERDPYEVLGVLRDADLETTDAVYRSKAKRLHPDVGGDPAKFKELQAAYEALKATMRP